MEQPINKLVEAFIALSPEMYQAMKTHVYFSTLYDLTVIGLCVLLLWIVTIMYNIVLSDYDFDNLSKSDKDSLALAKMIRWAIMGVVVIFSVFPITTIVEKLINPDYYVIQNVMSMF